jgi:hypothetical protein
VTGGQRRDTPDADVRQQLAEALPPGCRGLVYALLPVVDRIARQRAAEELRAAAEESERQHGTASLAAKRHRARAAAVRARTEEMT